MNQRLREINAIALPAIVTNITTPVLGLVDTTIAGHIGDGAVCIGAIAVGAAMFNLLYWVFNFLRMGTTGLTARHLGSGDTAQRDATLWRALLIAAAIAAVILMLQDACASLILRFMDCDDATAALARRYFDVLVWGAPAMLGSYAVTGWLLGVQNSKATMWIAVATNVVNIAVSLSLVFGLNLGIEGIAAGTLSAQWTRLIIGLAIIARRYRPAITRWSALLERSRLSRFFSINVDIFMRTLCLAAVTLWFTHAGAVQGVDTLAANALLMQLFMLFSFFMDGFAFAGEALSGKYAGRGDGSCVRSVAATLLKVAAVIALSFTVLYACLGEAFLNLLTDRAEVIAKARSYLPYAAAIPVAGAAAFAWDGIYVGLTQTRFMLLSMATAMALFFLSYTLLQPPLGNHGLWIAFLIYLLSRGLVETATWPRALRAGTNGK